MPVPSPGAGKVVKILVNEGDTIAVGAAILELDSTAAASAASEPVEKPAPPAAKAQVPPVPPAPTPEPVAQTAPPAAAPSLAPIKTAPLPPVDVPGDGYSSAAAGPAVRRLARELGVELRRVRPSGEGGRVTEEDVRSHVRFANEQSDSAAMQGVTPPGLPDSDGQGGIRREKLSRLRQTIARNMLASYSNIPQLTNFDDVDTTELERIRQDSKADYADSGIKLTAMPFLVKAVASALKLHPVINASIDRPRRRSTKNTSTLASRSTPKKVSSCRSCAMSTERAFRKSPASFRQSPTRPARAAFRSTIFAAELLQSATSARSAARTVHQSSTRRKSLFYSPAEAASCPSMSTANSSPVS